MDGLHIGYFRLIDKNTNSLIARYNYDKISRKERKELKEKLEKNENLSIYCDCSLDNIELKIASNLVIYNYQRNIGERHNPACPKYKDTDIIPWTYSQKDKAYKAGTYNTAQTYTVKINEFIFQREIKEIKDMLKECKKAAYRIITDKDIRLYNLINQDNFLPDKEYFVYGLLGKISKASDKYKSFIEILCILDKDPLRTISILVDKQTFDVLYSENRYYTLPEHKKPLLIGGWIYKDVESGCLFFSDIWLKAVDSIGKIF